MTKKDFVDGAHIVIEDWKELKLSFRPYNYTFLASYITLLKLFKRIDSKFSETLFNNYIKQRI